MHRLALLLLAGCLGPQVSDEVQTGGSILIAGTPVPSLYDDAAEAAQIAASDGTMWFTEALANQHEELEELKALLASLQGQTYQPQPTPEVPNLRALHPQGTARFEPNYTQKRLARHVKRNPITNSMHQQDVPPNHH